MSDGPRVQYRPAVITFLDILGFRERVERSQDATEIARILRRLRYFSNVGDPEETSVEGGYEVTRSIAFSDSVIRIRFFDTDFSTGALFHEILNLVHVQGEMAGEDVLLRGGVTIGEVHLDGDMVFGAGFNRAYDLESQFAVSPRIVIGQEAFDALRTDRRLISEDHTAEEDIAYIRRLVTRSDDGLWFVDYLAAMQGELDHPEYFPDYVAGHRAHIVDGATSASVRSRVFQKYLWLAHYLNGVVDRCGLPTALRLSQADIPAPDELADRPSWMSDAEYEGRD